ncbi:GNAT family N-acetyltransferase [Thermodesulfobacteriota bacterium]
MASNLTYHCSSNYLKQRDKMFALVGREYDSVNKMLYNSLYSGNPYGEPMLGLCFDGETLVGQENYIPQNVACNGTIYKGALGINTLVDSRYRVLQGVFGKLCRLTIDQMSPEVDILCAFANEESKPYYLKYFQWKIASQVRVYKKVTKYSGTNCESILSFFRPGKLHKAVTLEEVCEFDPGLLDPILEQQVHDSSCLYFHKTSKFLNWKYLNNKYYRVRGYYIRDNGKICGYCTTYDEGIEKKIVDILIEKNNRNIFKKVVSSVSHIARKQGLRRVVIHSTPGCWYEKTLQKLFFIKRWDYDFIIRPLNKKLQSNDWIISIGDFDIF